MIVRGFIASVAFEYETNTHLVVELSVTPQP